MKTRILPVIVTAALTSLGTLFVAAKFSSTPVPFLTARNESHLPVNYAGFNDGNTTVSPAVPPVDFQRAAESSVKAVVHIKTTTKARTVSAVEDPYGDMFGQLFGQRQYYMPPQMGSGSGVVVSQDGYIVTNNHVVSGADQVTVTFNDRYTTTAKVVGADPSTDIAVLKVEEKEPLAYMEFGNSDDVHLGQWVLAVGYPLTLDATVTAGIVSAKSRSIGINRSQSGSAIESFIQTDAAVNPGNSGGALVNAGGQLIGINSAIASPTGSYAGYSYAIPANIVRKVANDLMQYGSFQRGYLGIKYLDRRNITPEQNSAYKLDRTDGIYVDGVTPGGGAAAAGLQKGDFITQINGTAVQTEPELLEQVARYKPGDNLSVTYMRNGQSHITSVQLKNLNGNTAVTKQESSSVFMGATIRNLSKDEAGKYGLEGGVVVTDPGNGLLRTQTNLRSGFIITALNDLSISNGSDLQLALNSITGKAQLAGFYPGSRGIYYYGIDPGADAAGIQ